MGARTVTCRSIELEGGGCQFIGQCTKCECVGIFCRVLQSFSTDVGAAAS